VKAIGWWQEGGRDNIGIVAKIDVALIRVLGATGQEDAMHRKYRRLELGCGQGYNSSSAV
jgi:hypothetical protein